MRPLVHPSSSIVMFLFTLIILTNIPTSLRADDSQYKDCRKPFSCGGITKLAYPFWGVNRPKGCGEPNLEITCENGVDPKFTVDSVTYRILRWNLADLSVARDDYWSNLCQNDYKNDTLDKTVFKYDDMNIVNVTLLYSCNGTAPRSYTPLQNCSFGVYVAPQNTPSTYGSCKSVVVPFPKAQVQSTYSNNPSAIQSVLQEGIGLKWPQGYDECSKCYESSGACGYEDGGFICFCKDGSSNKTSCSGSGSSSRKWNWKIRAVIGASAAVGGVLVVFGMIICYRKRYFSLAQRRLVLFEKTGSFANHNVEDFINSYGFLAPKRYSYSEVKRITNSFRDQLGQGGYGVVYKGSLADGRNVAVKVISEFKGSGEEFINEVASISRTSHVNIVSLFGFCNEMNKRALIYEFMPNGSLDKFICKMGSPNAICDLAWNTLYQITISIARGLEYLHRGCSTRILHLDIKPQNILLDEDFCPKIADFGLAKVCKMKESIVSILGTRGTPGYIAPEVFSRTFGGVSHKSDVYSYGMLILEVVGGRKNYDSRGSNTSELYFFDWIYKDLHQGNIPTTCLVSTEEENDMVMKITLVSLWCIQANPSARPSMSKVVEMLEGPLQSVPYPPKPVLNFPELSPLQFSDISYSNIHETNSITSVENDSIK